MSSDDEQQADRREERELGRGSGGSNEDTVGGRDRRAYRAERGEGGRKNITRHMYFSTCNSYKRLT